jgi:hypothetical protein
VLFSSTRAFKGDLVLAAVHTYREKLTIESSAALWTELYTARVSTKWLGAHLAKLLMLWLYIVFIPEPQAALFCL